MKHARVDHGMRVTIGCGASAPRRANGCPLALLLCAVVAGCGRRESSGPAEEPLARVGDAIITESDFAYEIQRRAASGRHADDAQAVLGELIERAAMLQAANRAPWMQEPDLRRERENQVLAQWLERTLHEAKRQVTVTDDDLRAAYRAQPEAYASPALARLAILHRQAPRAGAAVDDDPAAALRRARQTYLDNPAAATRNGRIPGFGALAAEVSEDTASRYRGGDLGWLEVARRDYRWPAAVMEAGLALPTGGVSDVLHTDKGLYVVMKQDQREARITPFEEAAVSLRRRLLRDRQAAVEAEFKSNLLARAAVAVNRERAARLRVPGPPLPPKPADWLPVAGLTNTPHMDRRTRMR